MPIASDGGAKRQRETDILVRLVISASQPALHGPEWMKLAVMGTKKNGLSKPPKSRLKRKHKKEEPLTVIVLS